MKISEDSPTQHIAILVLAGVFIFFSVISSLKAPDRTGGDGSVTEEEQGTYADTGMVMYGNPHMTWYERIFCRGFQRASFCSYRMLHPLKSSLEDRGVKIKEEPPKQRGAILYRGELPRNNAFSGKVVLDDL